MRGWTQKISGRRGVRHGAFLTRKNSVRRGRKGEEGEFSGEKGAKQINGKEGMGGV